MTAQSDSLPVRGRRRKNVRATSDGSPAPAARTPVAAERLPSLRAGWRVIAAKEFADHVTSVRFLVLTIVLALAAAAAVYSTAGGLRNAAAELAGASSLFLALFTEQVGDIPSFSAFIAFLGPLLGVAFGFDAINGERSDGTLPRLLAQPIHRDDVINGKFVAGLSAIGLILFAVVGIVGAVGVIQIGIVPSAEDVLRLMIWFIVALAYIGFWLAFALLCSVLLRRAATSALAALAVWLALSVFFSLLVGIAAGVVSPVDSSSPQGSADRIANNSVRINLSRLAPYQLYSESTAVLLNPRARTSTPGLVTPGQVDQIDVRGLVSLEQSVLLISGQFALLIAVTVGAFALSYVAFMRQEVRA
jgi:ABC-2 type transport system permease protein